MSASEHASRTILYPNFGAEEKRDAKRASRELLRLVSLWQGLFPQDAEVLLPTQVFPPGTPWERATIRGPAEACDSSTLIAGRLSGARGLVRWLPDEISSAEGERLGVKPWGPDTGTVAEVHDKAFATRAAASIADPAWSALSFVLEPEDLRSPESIEKRITEWPSERRRRFTLKPRIGTSGRGRVSGRAGHLDVAGRRGLAGLAARGGAILEPWFDRVADLSAQYWIEPGGRPELLGTTRQLLADSGIYLGNEGVFAIDQEGGLQVRSGHPADAPLIDDTTRLVERAAAAGFHGPCGVDAFTYRDPVDDDKSEALRSIVELNARFTTGTIALGWLEKLCRERVRPNGPLSGRWRFLFAPEMVRKQFGEHQMPKTDQGWETFPIGARSNPALLALRWNRR